MRFLIQTCSFLCVILGCVPPLAGQGETPEAKLSRVGRFPSIGGRVTGIVFPPQPDRVVSLGEKGDLLVWNLRTMSLVAQFPVEASATGAIAAHPSRPIVALAAGKGVIFRNLDTCARVFVPCQGRVTGLCFGPEGRRLLTVQRGVFDVFAVLLSELPDPLSRNQIGKISRRSFLVPQRQHSVPRFDPTGRSILLSQSALGGGHGVLNLREPKKGWSFHQGTVHGFRKNGEPIRIVERSGSFEVVVGIKRVPLPNRLSFLRGQSVDLRDGVLAWSFSTFPVDVHLFDLEAGTTKLVPAPASTLVLEVRMTPDGSVLALAGGDRILVHGRGTMGGHAGPAEDLLFSPDGQYVAARSRSGTVVATLDGRVVRVFRGETVLHPGRVGSEFVVIRPGSISLWSASNGTENLERQQAIQASKGPLAWMMSARSSVGARYVFVEERKRETDRFEIDVLDVDRGAKFSITRPPYESKSGSPPLRPEAVASRRDGSQFALGFRSLGSPRRETGALEVYETATKKLVLVDREEPVSALAYHPDGRRLLVCSPSGLLRVYEADRFKIVGEQEGDHVVFEAHWPRPDRIVARTLDQLLVYSWPGLRVLRSLPLPGSIPRPGPLDLPYFKKPAPFAFRWRRRKSMLLSPDLKHLAFARDRHVEVFRLNLDLR